MPALSIFQLWEFVYPVLFAFGGFLVIAYRWERTPGVRRGVDRVFRRFLGPRGLARLRLSHLLGAVGAVMVAAVSYDYLSRYFACGPNGVDDPVNLWLSGRSFLSGGDPFTATSCHKTVDVPYGLAAILLDAGGSPGGLFGASAGAYAVWLVWLLVALTVLPLVWSLGGKDRLYLTVVVVSSLLYIPIVIGQIDGASNVIVPVAVLATIWLGRERWTHAGLLGGFLATARWPSLFPSLGTFGQAKGWERWTAPIATVVSFGVLSALTYLRWGSEFTDAVFFNQIDRLSGSLNVFGILIDHNWAPGGNVLTVLQAVGTLVLVLEVNRRRFSPEGGAAVVLVGVALLTQFLSVSILIWLLPVVLMGAAPQRTLYVVGVIGIFNYGIFLNVLAWDDGIYWPSEVLEGAMTLVLLVLLWQVWQAASAQVRKGSETGTGKSPEEATAPESAGGTPVGPMAS